MTIVDDHAGEVARIAGADEAAAPDRVLRRRPTRPASGRNPRHGGGMPILAATSTRPPTPERGVDDDAAERLAGATGLALQHVVGEGHRLVEIARAYCARRRARTARARHGCRTRPPDGRRRDRAPGRRRRSSGWSAHRDRSGRSDRSWHNRQAQRQPGRPPSREMIRVHAPANTHPDLRIAYTRESIPLHNIGFNA